MTLQTPPRPILFVFPAWSNHLAPTGVRFWLLLLGFLTALPLQAQDLIVKMDDEEIIAKILEIKQSKVQYYAYSDQTGDPLSLNKSDIYMIIFEDGMKQFFSDPRDLKDIIGAELGDEELQTLYLKGIEDASQYFDRKGLMWATMGTTVFFPFMGIFAGGALVGILAMTPAKFQMEEVPQLELYRNPYYAQGFKEQAQKIKIKRSLQGFGLGTAIQALFLIIVLAAG